MSLTSIADIWIQRHLPGKHNQKDHAGRTDSPYYSGVTRDGKLQVSTSMGRTGLEVRTIEGRELGEVTSDEFVGRFGSPYVAHPKGKSSKTFTSGEGGEQRAVDYIIESQGLSKEYGYDPRAIELERGRAEQERRAELKASHQALSSAYKSWESGLTPSERASVDFYASPEAEAFNDALRRGKPTSQQLERARSLDSALSKVASPRDLTVYRGIRLTTSELSRFKVGFRFRDQGFVSTSLDSDVAYDFASRDVGPGTGRGRPLVFTLRLPKGSPGGYIDATSFSSDEKEFLLPRGRKFRVVRRHSSGQVDLELVR